ncbi:MAG: hypothetical protein Q8P41_19265 [Pseudomonadota bacterium]|nr:hypothetical protein [Pseudomonadota bacterium]
MRSVAIAFLLGLGFFGALHALEPRLADYDGYFHVRYASLGPGEWLGREFRWMPYSVFADGRWVDHQWLFHALIWPFTLVLPLLAAAKASGAVFAASMLAAFAWLLADRGAARPALWALALLGASRFFDDRMLMPRTQSLSLAFLFVGLALAFRGRARAVGLVAVLFAWTYHVSVMLVPCALVAGLAGGAARGRVKVANLAPALYAALGIGLAYAAHPQSPHTFSFLWLHAVEKVLNPSGQAVGAEWLPVDTQTWLLHMAPLLALGAWGAWGAPTGGQGRAAADTRAMALLTAGWIVASAFSVKWLEYAVPFGVLTLALLWRDGGRSTALLWLGAPLALMHGATVLDHVRGTVPPADRLQALASHLPPGECAVFHADWTDFSELFYWAPQCSYVVGLDPHFLSGADPLRATLVEGALAGKVSRLGAMADEKFGAGWVVTTHPAMEAKAAADPRLERVYLEEGAGLWRVRAAETGGDAGGGALPRNAPPGGQGPPGPPEALVMDPDRTAE